MPEKIFKHRASVLMLKYLQDCLSGAEKHELDNWIAAAPEHKELFEEMTNSNQVAGDLTQLDSLKERISRKMYDAIPEARRTIPIYRKTFFRVASVAAVFILLVTGTYFLFFHHADKPPAIVKETIPFDLQPPASNRAMVTLANGEKIYLDSAMNGELIMQDHIKLVKLADGQIAYENDNGETTAAIKYNTLTNPRGSKVIDMVLSDGSHVWLNAGSSITYPLAFINKERRVSMTGEAYFEIRHDPDKPFFVNKDDLQVEVTGTHFNVKAYDEEDAMKVTLLEGSVRIKAKHHTALLKPGQQAVIQDQLKVLDDVDTEVVMAWKNGRFKFQDMSVEETLRELARWYDVEVVYQSLPSNQHFNGGITSRDVAASKIFEMLESTGVMHVRIEGKKIIVLP